MYPSKLKYDEDQINNLINMKIETLEKRGKLNHRIEEHLLEEMALPYDDFKKKYKMTDNRNKMFLVNDFAQIGWADPFAHENSTTGDDLKHMDLNTS